MADETKPFNALDAMDLVRAALEPDERKFFKQYLGDESPGLSDWISPQGRFRDARHMRNKIADMVVTEAFKQSQAPIVGDAQTLFPGHKELIPEQAWQKAPQAPLSSNEMPTLQGTQQTVIPDTRFQGPMPGVMTPLGQQSVNLIDARQPEEPFPLNAQDRTNFLERGPEFYQEGPRPTRVATTGIYGPETAPAEATELNKSMKLPPAFQAQLGALQHQLSTRQPVPHVPSAEETKYSDAMRIGLAAWQEDHPGQIPTAKDIFTIQQTAAGGYSKESRPGSTQADIDTLNKKVLEPKAKFANEQEQANLAHTKASTAEAEAKENEIRILMDAKLKKLEAEANAANAAGSKESMKAYFQEQLALLNRGKVAIDLAVEGRKGGKMDDKSYATLMDLGLGLMNVGMGAQQTERNWLQEHFGTKPPVEVTPRPSTEPPRTLRPQGAPMPALPQSNVAPPVLPQTTPSSSLADQERSELLGLIKSMKDGEVKSYKGKSYKRQGNALVPVTKDK